MRRPHPLMIVTSMGRYGFLLLVPLVRGFWTSLSGGFYLWLQSVWIDLSVLLFMVILAVARWLRAGYNWDCNGLHVHIGLFWQRDLFFPVAHLSSLSLWRDASLLPFQAVRLRLNTRSQEDKPDCQLFLWEKDVQTLVADFPELQTSLAEYQPKNLRLVLFSALLSNSFAGVVFAWVFIKESGRMLG